MSTLIRAGWLIVGCALSVARLSGVMDNRFQALAHLCVGAWLGAWAMGRSYRTLGEDNGPRFYLAIAMGASMVELLAFLYGIGKVDGR